MKKLRGPTYGGETVIRNRSKLFRQRRLRWVVTWPQLVESVLKRIKA